MTGLTMEIAPEKAKLKARAARAGRHVRIRLAADGMADLVAHLPAEQAAACLGALHRAVHEHYVTAETVTRSRGQILADTLVERLTGQTTAGDVNVEVQILVPVEALLDPTSPLPAQIAGHGPIPADIARKCSRARSPYAGWSPATGSSSAATPDADRSTGYWKPSSGARTETGAPHPMRRTDRHIDHKERWADSGDTEFANGRELLCELHNHAREPLRMRRERVRDPAAAPTAVRSGGRTPAARLTTHSPRQIRHSCASPVDAVAPTLTGRQPPGTSSCTS